MITYYNTLTSTTVAAFFVDTTANVSYSCSDYFHGGDRGCLTCSGTGSASFVCNDVIKYYEAGTSTLISPYYVDPLAHIHAYSCADIYHLGMQGCLHCQVSGSTVLCLDTVQYTNTVKNSLVSPYFVNATNQLSYPCSDIYHGGY